MPISYHEQSRVFRLDTPGSTYLIALVDDEGFLAHLYYGRPIPDCDLRHLLRLEEYPTPSRRNGERLTFYDMLPTEYSGHGVGDLRESCLSVETPQGARACCLTYLSHRIFRGKPKLEGLPATFGGQDDCATLDLVCQDPALGLRVHLIYTAFAHLDAICRSVLVENVSSSARRLNRVLSACLDMDNQAFDLITLHGCWGQERMISRAPLTWGRQGTASLRGISSHQEQPFLALAEHTATQTQGQVYAANFVYSGNFLAQVELRQQNDLRLVMGIHPTDFCWNLAPGARFQAPEVVLVYSSAGLDHMSHTFHDLYRRHLIRGPYRDRPRPALINSWEATYFDFDTQRLLALGRLAAQAGIELMVLDDGWFGRRNSDDSSLGDWTVNEEKLPGGLKHLAEELNKLGLKLGLWMEPEMVSPDSDLYRAHPEYALKIPGRAPTLARNQLVLDLSQPQVRQAVYRQISAVLRSAPIDYVKWDMNRTLCDVYSSALPPQAQGELYHRYVLGVYELQERLLSDFPHLLLENCCGGGGRFDPGMLYFSPQIWTSDNTDAIDRLRIQEGTALVYPLSAMGAHVAACPSHINRRTTDFITRGRVSLPGCFGYELDLAALSPEELAAIPAQLEEYRTYGHVFRTGDYYRLASFRENHEYDAILAVTKDKSLAVIDFVQVYSRLEQRSLRLPLAGLDPARRYRCQKTGQVLSGAGWMYGGLPLPKLKGDYLSCLIVLEAVEG